MKKLWFIFSLLLFISCKKENKNPYVGNWYFDEIVDYDSSKTHSSKQMFEREYGPYYNFNIINDSVLDFKNGFLYRINGYMYKNNFRSNYYLGTKTNYKINNSNILFYNKSEKEWDTIQIKKISNDTMIVLGMEKCKYRLIRKQNNYFNNSNFDAITISNSYCMGSCPSNTTYINRNGDFCFRGADNNTEIGIFYSKLNLNQVDEIFNEFDKIDVTKLKPEYGGLATDSPTNMISFFKNGKIVKTVECYNNIPIDLDKEFTALSFYYQQVHLKSDENFMLYENIWYRSFNTVSEVYELKESESFFLEVAMRNGRKIKYNFIPKYYVDFSQTNEQSDIKKIVSDGRYYKFTKSDKSTFTIDIGYNFVDVNSLLKKKRRN